MIDGSGGQLAEILHSQLSPLQTVYTTSDTPSGSIYSQKGPSVTGESFWDETISNASDALLEILIDVESELHGC